MSDADTCSVSWRGWEAVCRVRVCYVSCLRLLVCGGRPLPPREPKHQSRWGVLGSMAWILGRKDPHGDKADAGRMSYYRGRPGSVGLAPVGDLSCFYPYPRASRDYRVGCWRGQLPERCEARARGSADQTRLVVLAAEEDAVRNPRQPSGRAGSEMENKERWPAGTRGRGAARNYTSGGSAGFDDPLRGRIGVVMYPGHLFRTAAPSAITAGTDGVEQTAFQPGQVHSVALYWCSRQSSPKHI
ncbi:hypothetical protein BT67DRAFT_271029 [Trichocladium antarcticum]|uniref:Uncharacterized protein n=1 Tax=Trichocladium antarcticum TaxID=1450529 RepID=A0AAN6ZDQ8_9PEZI|nr:hypothetical protein BT67DRAFT_271029 [Trichocladium antarcticum]